jgi:hypothetical protein
MGQSQHMSTPTEEVAALKIAWLDAAEAADDAENVADTALTAFIVCTDAAEAAEDAYLNASDSLRESTT